MPITKTEGEKVRFVGKHSKDTNLSIYLQKRNIFEIETENGPTCEQLGCIVRIKDDRLVNDKVIVVGVLVRIICDFGLQYTEHVLYQLEAQLHPRMGLTLQPHPECVGGVFDFETRFVTALPDNYHIPFLVKLPKGLPSSIHLRNAGVGGAHWGLTYYVFAYLTNERAAQSTLERHGIEGAWPRMRLGRRHSKVFLSFSKTNISAVERICRSVPASTGMSKRKSFLSSGSPLILEASLDKSAYRAGEPIRVTLRIRNSGRQRISGIRITLKQLLTVKFGSEPRQVIKSTVAEYEGHEQQLRDAMQLEANVMIDTKYNQHRSGYQIALESQLPHLPETSKTLAASCVFSGPSFNGISFGIEKLKIFSLEYYVNVHAVIPWASNVIVKLPFFLISNGGEARAFDASVPSTLNMLTNNSMKPPQMPNLLDSKIPLKGHLISFDVDDDDHGSDDIDVDQVEEKHPVDSLFSVSKKSASKKDLGTNHGGVSWNEDILSARSILESSRTAINDIHRKTLNGQLDRRSLALQCSPPKRLQMNKTFLEQINGLLGHDIGDLKASLVLSRQSDCKLPRFYAAQAAAFRLNTLGASHAEIVPLSVGKDLIEERLEGFARIMDDFELFLARADRSPLDNATVVLDRISYRAGRLIYDLPGYQKIENALRLLSKTFVLRRWGFFKNHHVADPHDDHSDSDDEGQEEDCNDALSSSDDAEQKLAIMASQFQNIYNGQVNDGDSDPDYDAFPPQFHEYSQNLRLLLSSELSADATLSVIGYFHWRFLFAVAEQYYLGSVGNSFGKLLFNRLRDSIRWSKEVESRVPARFLLDAKPEDELEDTANQIVTAMQNII